MNSKEKTIKDYWMKMTEEEKRPYNEMALKIKEANMLIKHTHSKQKLKSKLVLLGVAGVGKASLINAIKNEEFSDNYNPTLNVNISTITFQTSSNNPIIFECYGIAGQEKYCNIMENYYNNSDCMFLMFDFTNPKSYKNLSTWYQEFARRNMDLNNPNANVPCILIGNKVENHFQKLNKVL